MYLFFDKLPVDFPQAIAFNLYIVWHEILAGVIIIGFAILIFP